MVPRSSFLALFILIVGSSTPRAVAQTPYACPGDSCYSECFARIPNIKDKSCYGDVESNQCQCLVAAIACARSCHCYQEEACQPDMGLWHANHRSQCEFPCRPSLGRHGDKGDHSHAHDSTEDNGPAFHLDRSYGRNLDGNTDTDGAPLHKTAGGHPVAYSPERLAELIRQQSEKEAQGDSSSSETPRWVLPVIVSSSSFCLCCTGFIIWYIYSSNKRRKHNEMHHRGGAGQQGVPGGMMQSMGPNNMGGNMNNMANGNMGGNMGISNPQPMGSLPYKG